MKKLTAGIFATLLAVVSADSAYAAIASQGYVDDKVEAVETTVAGKADSTTVTALDTRVKTAEGEIDTLQSEVAGKADKATTLSGYGITDAYTSAQGNALAARVSAVEAPKAQVAANVTGPVSGGTVYTAIQNVSGNVGTVTSDVATLKENMTQAQTDISGLKEASATHATKTELAAKQNRNMGSSAANSIVTTDGSGNITASATIAASKVSGLGSLATKSSVATTDIASKAVTKEKLADDIVTSLGRADSALQQADLADYVTETEANAAYAVKTLETQVGTVSKENMGTTTATTVVAGVKEAIDAAKAADTKAGQAKTAATTAQGAVDTLEETVSEQGTRLTAAEGDIDTIQGKISNMATSDAVTKLTERVTTAEGDITALETAVNDAESGLVATNAIADEALANAATAQKAAEAAQTTADAKQDKLTGTIGGSMQPVYLNNGTITAGTALGSLATKSKVTNTEVDDGALAQSKISGLATSLAAKLTTPPTSERGETGLYVLTYNGTDFQWEDIARTVAD